VARTAPAVPEVELERLLEEFVTAYDSEFARAANTVGLSGAQACALGWTEVQMSMSALARVLACDASNVSQIVARLEAQGLVERTVDGDDRRVKLVRITLGGRRTYQRVRAQFGYVRDALGRLDERERRELHRLLEKMSRPLNGLAPGQPD
jgi:DNA-binding MarR family transcriptional regulator